MPDMGAGPKLYHFGYGVDTLSLSPQVPNAAIVRRVLLDSPSASDIWVVRTNGQEVGRFRHITSLTQNFLYGFKTMYDINYDVFDYCREVLGTELIYPIPEGKTLTVSSLGGATANIAIEYEEFSPSALNSSMVNFPGGGYFLNPVWFSLAAHPTAEGEYSIDTEIGLDFVPTLFVKESFPVGWKARVLDLFLAVQSINTYSGAADAISNMDHLAAIRSGQRLFTRDASGGIPLHAVPAAAGSANGNGNIDINPTTAFSAVPATTKPFLDTPIEYRPGYVFDWRVGFTGAFTGGPDYSNTVHAAIAEYRSS